jgi:SynChlorMet cassette protein ScmC
MISPCRSFPLAVERSRSCPNPLTVRLGNGCAWQIVPDSGTDAWARKLGGVLGILRGRSIDQTDHHRIFLSSRLQPAEQSRAFGSKLAAVCGSRLPRSGWDPINLGVLRLWLHPTCTDILCCLSPKNDHVTTVLQMQRILVPIYLHVCEDGGMPLHAALVESSGRGCVLVGSGGAGKTTCCGRLPSTWSVLGEDAALVLKNRFGDCSGQPLPTWSDHFFSRDTRDVSMNRSVTLRALVFVEQAETDEFIPLAKGEAAALATQSALEIFYQVWWQMGLEKERWLRRMLFDNAATLVKSLPTYRLRSTVKGKFWECIEEVL